MQSLFLYGWSDEESIYVVDIYIVLFVCIDCCLFVFIVDRSMVCLLFMSSMCGSWLVIGS